MKALILSLYMVAASAAVATAQTKTAAQADIEPSYGKYMEVQPISFSTAKNGKRMHLQNNPKRIDPVVQPAEQVNVASTHRPSRVEGKLVADKPSDKASARNNSSSPAFNHGE